MKVLALEQSAPGADQHRLTSELLRDEAAMVWRLYQSSVVREIHFRADRREAVLILECDSPDEARRQLTQLPLVAAGLIRFEVIPLAPYSGLSRLFERDS